MGRYAQPTIQLRKFSMDLQNSLKNPSPRERVEFQVESFLTRNLEIRVRIQAVRRFLWIYANKKLDCFRLIAFAMTARLKVWHTFITYTLLSINNFIKWTTIAPRTCVRTWDVTLRQAFIEKIKFCILLMLADKIFTCVAQIVSVRVQALLATSIWTTLVRA